MSRTGDREIQFLKTEDPARGVLHEDNLVPCLFTDVLARPIRKPDGERLAPSVVEHLHFGHICTPPLIASVDHLRPPGFVADHSMDFHRPANVMLTGALQRVR